MTDPNQPDPVQQAVAVSPTDQSSDRAQSDRDHAAIVNRLDTMIDEQANGAAHDERVAHRGQADADQSITVGKLDELIRSSDALTAAAGEGLERERLARSRFRMSMTALGVATVTCLAVLGLILFGVHRQLDTAAQQRDQLADCIQPTGKCFKDGQARTGEAVGSINQVSVLAAACAPDYVSLPLPQRTAAIRACIVRGLPK